MKTALLTVFLSHGFSREREGEYRSRDLRRGSMARHLPTHVRRLNFGEFNRLKLEFEKEMNLSFIPVSDD